LILLNQSKISSLILIDPVQKDRNAAAALGHEKFFLNFFFFFLKKIQGLIKDLISQCHKKYRKNLAKKNKVRF